MSSVPGNKAHKTVINSQYLLMSRCKSANLSLFSQQAQEYIDGIVEVHGTAQPDNSVRCDNYIMFDPQASQTFG